MVASFEEDMTVFVLFCDMLCIHKDMMLWLILLCAFPLNNAAGVFSICAYFISLIHHNIAIKHIYNW